MYMAFMIGIQIACLIIALIGFLLSVFCFIELRALQKSTHSIQYVEAPYPGTKIDEHGFEELSEEVKKTFSEDEDYFN